MNLQSPQEPVPLEQSHLTLSTAPIDGNRSWQIAAFVFALLSFLELSRILDIVHVHAISVLIALLAIVLPISGRAFVFGSVVRAGRSRYFWHGLSWLTCWRRTRN